MDTKRKTLLAITTISIIFILLILIFRVQISMQANNIAALTYYKYPSHFTETIWHITDQNPIISNQDKPVIYLKTYNKDTVSEFNQKEKEIIEIPTGISFTTNGQKGIDSEVISELIYVKNNNIRSITLKEEIVEVQPKIDEVTYIGTGELTNIENQFTELIKPAVKEGYSYLGTDWIENKNIKTSKDSTIIGKTKVEIESCNQYGVIPVIFDISSYSYSIDESLIAQLHNISCEEVVAPNLTQIALCNDCLYFPVDKTHGLEQIFSPITKTSIWDGVEFSIDERAFKNFENLLLDAKAAGHNINLTSTYRSYNTQVDTFKYWTDYNQNLFGYSRAKAIEEANKVSAKPGFSEHQLGTAADITAKECKDFEGYCKENDALWSWLADNARNYGFILSYPYNKEDQTGYTFEPWHYRWIGIQNTRIYLEQDKTLNNWLEEFYYRD
ncbi:M15 family metallopeptidase [Candidatus Dojkabacteria bacterium]|uniref:M15 family metallopeptidase n=1 Tax=Candidatus Dojkabacteria bacterium TaxID=2099670 RepID=A0A955RHU4_9BACT|nr:M15 family metallopeptidase [Candidatus Dojkabacteria bacterium]